MISYPLFSAIGFTIVCFIIGLPIVQLLLREVDFRSRYLLAPVFGYTTMIVFIQPLVQFAGPIKNFFAVTWIIVILCAFIYSRLFYRSYGTIDINYKTICTIALSFSGIYLALISTPLFGGINYAIYRTNPSDAFVNISLADLWVHTPWSTIKAYLQGLGTATELSATTDLLAESPIGIFSARFVRFDVRLVTSMMLGLHAVLFGLPAYLIYLPFQLSSLIISSLSCFGMLRFAGTPRWVSIVIGASFVGGWSYIIRESDNSNQLTVLPLMVGALFLTMMRFDAQWTSRWRSAIAIGLVLSAGVTVYPELGLIFGAGIGCALIVRGYLKNAGRAHWFTVAGIAIATSTFLIINGQARILPGWINVLRSGELNLGNIIGPTGTLLSRDGLIAAFGIYKWDNAMVVICWVLVIFIALWMIIILTRGIKHSYVGGSIFVYFMCMLCIGLKAKFDNNFYVVSRSASFVGMIVIPAIALLHYVAVKNSRALHWMSTSKAKNFGAFILTAWVIAGFPFWLMSFYKPETGYTTIASRDIKAGFPPENNIETAIKKLNGETIGVYLPPARESSVPWPAFFYMHLISAAHGAVFLSGFMNDNTDVRMSCQNYVYGQKKFRDISIPLLLVWERYDPISRYFNGNLIASDNVFRLYRIKPTQLIKIESAIITAFELKNSHFLKEKGNRK
jgi:hypothetical protein